MINALWLCLDCTLLKPDLVQARLYSRDELIEIYKELLIKECEQSLTKDDILGMDKSVFHDCTKLLSFYLVCSTESSDHLLRRHGISKMDLYMQMGKVSLFHDFEIINMAIRLKTSACLERNFIREINLEQMTDDVKAL